MTEQSDVISRFVKKQRSSLKSEMTIMVILALLIGIALNVIVRFSAELIISHGVLSEGNRLKRENRAFDELQFYVTEHDLSSNEMEEIREWVSAHGYVYLAIYEGNTLIFSSGVGGVSSHSPMGIGVEFPTQEELDRFAAEGGTRALAFSDETLLCTVTDYTQYLYYNISNFLSFAIAVLAVVLILILYFRRVVLRISHLSSDVAAVAAGNQSHAIHVDTLDDEISVLTANVEEMRASIIRTLESERAAINANTELITSMSHDIRTPLTVLLGYLDVMKLCTTDETLTHYIKASEKTALRLKDLSDDLFQYFLVFSGKDMDVSLQEYNAATLMDQLLTEHVVLMRERGYTILTDEGEMPGDYPETTVVTDAPKLMRVIDNLFSNFSKYSDKSQPIRISFSFDFDNITLQFENKIAKNNTYVESTGIGLKTCARIADRIGSTFSVDSDDENFTVILTVPLPKKEGGA